MSSQPMRSGQASPPAASPEFLDRSDPEAEIARAVRAYSNWGRWGADDVLGSANFLTAAPLPITGAVGSPVNPIAVK